MLVGAGTVGDKITRFSILLVQLYSSTMNKSWFDKAMDKAICGSATKIHGTKFSACTKVNRLDRDLNAALFLCRKTVVSH